MQPPILRQKLSSCSVHHRDARARVAAQKQRARERAGLRSVASCGWEGVDLLAEHWATFEALDMMQQIGMVPVPGPALLVRTLLHQARKLLARASSRRR